MDNDYIKSLEKRIEALENAINILKIDNQTAVNISNCQIQALALENCKNTDVTNNSMENLASVGYKTVVNNSSINNLTVTDAGKKTKYNNCCFNSKHK